ncbi:MAG TPA: hypothetical protein VEF04_22505 [Blastocatellia bacterium]|nr:hypothetical protein [Blastocatellia bacterium]
MNAGAAFRQDQQRALGINQDDEQCLHDFIKGLLPEVSLDAFISPLPSPIEDLRRLYPSGLKDLLSELTVTPFYRAPDFGELLKGLAFSSPRLEFERLLSGPDFNPNFYLTGKE